MGNLKEALRTRRKDKGFSQKELAKKVGVTQQYVARIESGKLNPGLDLMEKLADALDCELGLLLKQDV